MHHITRSWLLMKVFVRSFILALIALCLTVGAAAAAAKPLPLVPGGTYTGFSHGHFRVRVVVNRRPTKKGGRVYGGQVTYCGHTGFVFIVPPTPKSPLYHFGELAKMKTIGVPVTLYRIYGAFTTRTHVGGRIDLDFASGCDGLPGPWSANLAS
jgi:hypothetical protein